MQCPLGDLLAHADDFFRIAAPEPSQSAAPATRFDDSDPGDLGDLVFGVAPGAQEVGVPEEGLDQIGWIASDPLHESRASPGELVGFASVKKYRRDFVVV